jgi:hypothetical protein
MVALMGTVMMKSTLQNRLVRLTLLSTGALLLVAGCLKLYGLHVSPVSRVGWFAWSSVQIVVGQWELLLGLWLVSGWGRLPAWLAALATFLAFAGVSSYMGWIGVANCGCFGAIRASPWVAFGVDAAVVVALATLGRPRQSEATGKPNQLLTAILEPGPSIVIVGAVLLSGITAWAFLKYDSLHLAIARLGGEHLTVDEPYLDLGSVNPGDVVERSIVVRNWSGGSVRIIGVSESCACDLPTQLPAAVPPSGLLAMPVRMAVPRSGTGMFVQPMYLWTDCSHCPTVKFEVGGRITRRLPSQ